MDEKVYKTYTCVNLREPNITCCDSTIVTTWYYMIHGLSLAMNNQCMHLLKETEQFLHRIISQVGQPLVWYMVFGSFPKQPVNY